MIQTDYDSAKIECDDTESKIKLAQTRVSEIKEEITAVIGEDIFSSAKVAGATLMSVAINQRIKRANFDVLIVDETSMANVPMLLLAMQAVGKKVILFGDPMQLPPVAQTKELKVSIYDILGIKDSFLSGKVHPKCVLLDTQYRCHPEIAQLNSELFTEVCLKMVEL